VAWVRGVVVCTFAMFVVGLIVTWIHAHACRHSAAKKLLWQQSFVDEDVMPWTLFANRLHALVLDVTGQVRVRMSHTVVPSLTHSLAHSLARSLTGDALAAARATELGARIYAHQPQVVRCARIVSVHSVCM
jgi:hypothetical protein